MEDEAWKGRKKICDENIMEWIIDTGQPSSVVETPGFHRMFNTASQGHYKPMCRQTVAKNIEAMRAINDQQVGAAIDLVDFVGMMNDTWTSDYTNTNHCGWIVSVPNMDGAGDGYLDYYVLGMPKTPYEHNAEALQASLVAIKAKMKLENKISGICTDSAAMNPCAFDIKGQIW